MITLDETKKFVQMVHGDQFDRTGEPYYNHLLAVMNGLPPEHATLENQILALLHDTVEDRSKQILILSKGVPVYDYLTSIGVTPYVIEGLKLVTRLEDVSYMDYIRNIANSKHLGALLVKISDNKHNSDPERIASIPDEETRKQYEDMAKSRYARAARILHSAKENWNLSTG